MDQRDHRFDYDDVLLDIPDLDGIIIRPGTSIALTHLETARPILVLGDRLTYHGAYVTAIGTIASFQPSSQANILEGSDILRLLSTTTKRVVFTRVAGQQEDVQALTDAVLFKRGKKSSKAAKSQGPRGALGDAKKSAAKVSKRKLAEVEEQKQKGAPRGKRRRKAAVEKEEEEEEGGG